MKTISHDFEWTEEKYKDPKTLTYWPPDRITSHNIICRICGSKEPCTKYRFEQCACPQFFFKSSKPPTRRLPLGNQTWLGTPSPPIQVFKTIDIGPPSNYIRHFPAISTPLIPGSIQVPQRWWHGRLIHTPGQALGLVEIQENSARTGAPFASSWC